MKTWSRSALTWLVWSYCCGLTTTFLWLLLTSLKVLLTNSVLSYNLRCFFFKNSIEPSKTRTKSKPTTLNCFLGISPIEPLRVHQDCWWRVQHQLGEAQRWVIEQIWSHTSLHCTFSEYQNSSPLSLSSWNPVRRRRTWTQRKTLSLRHPRTPSTLTTPWSTSCLSPLLRMVSIHVFFLLVKGSTITWQCCWISPY